MNVLAQEMHFNPPTVMSFYLTVIIIKVGVTNTSVFICKFNPHSKSRGTRSGDVPDSVPRDLLLRLLS